MSNACQGYERHVVQRASVWTCKEGISTNERWKENLIDVGGQR